MRRPSLETWSFAAALLAGLAGCGGGEVHPVSGRLTVGGRPAPNAMVAFHPVGRGPRPGSLPVASTGPDGSYRLRTRSVGDGAPAGDYAVTVVWPDDPAPGDECEGVVARDRFLGRYADPAASPWRVRVVPGPNEVPLRAEAGDRPDGHQHEYRPQRGVPHEDIPPTRP